MSMLVRPLTAEDLEVLSPLDRSYARHFGCEELVSSASLSFFERSGHSFAMEEGGKAVGFVLAQAVWGGSRPTITAKRIVAQVDGGREALLEALTKSAYDAGVYDIVVEQPQNDSAGERALESCGYAPRPARLYSRVLGSRSRSG